MSVFSYVRSLESEGQSGAVLRVHSEEAHNYLLTTLGGVAFERLEGEDLEATLARAANDGVKMKYGLSDFKTWWTDHVSAETKALWTEGWPLGFFSNEDGDYEVVLSTETGEPVSQEELEAAGIEVDGESQGVPAEAVEPSEPAEDTDPSKSNGDEEPSEANHDGDSAPSTESVEAPQNDSSEEVGS